MHEASLLTLITSVAQNYGDIIMDGLPTWVRNPFVRYREQDFAELLALGQPSSQPKMIRYYDVVNFTSEDLFNYRSDEYSKHHLHGVRILVKKAMDRYQDLLEKK